MKVAIMGGEAHHNCHARVKSFIQALYTQKTMPVILVEPKPIKQIFEKSIKVFNRFLFSDMGSSGSGYGRRKKRCHKSYYLKEITKNHPCHYQVSFKKAQLIGKVIQYKGKMCRITNQINKYGNYRNY